MNTYDYERAFFNVDSNLPILRDLRNEYLHFNVSCAGNTQRASQDIVKLIQKYETSQVPIFVRFAQLLRKYREPIINSFILLERFDTKGNLLVSRLSNGPIEALNRKAKDLKRLGRGYTNFNHLRNRFLFATRSNSALNGRVKEKTSEDAQLRFKKGVTKELQAKLLAELSNLLEKYKDCTKDELLSLRHWVSEGNSPYTNPDTIYDETGMLADFITASRIVEEAFNEIDRN